MSHLLARSLGMALIWVLLGNDVIAASLPELAAPSTLSGASTSARFFGGVSQSGASSFDTDFQSHEAIDMTVQLQPEAKHVGVAGEVYVLAELDGQFFMRNTVGEFLPWNLELETLQATLSSQSLTSTVRIDLLDRAVLGTFDLAGLAMNFYLAYSAATDEDELYFSGSPLRLNVQDYDPQALAVVPTDGLELSIVDTARNREIPILFYPSSAQLDSPVILFSHGLGGTRYSATYLAEHWSARGYAVVSMQHAGSDEGIFDVPPSQVLESFAQAASLENSIARIQDVSAVIDQLELWNSDPQHDFFQLLNLDAIGMSGHSFGAVTTQAVSGQTLFTTTEVTRDSRIKAAMPLSPSVPSLGSAELAFASVDIPWLLMTGTLDDAPVEGVGSDVEGRLAVFPALPDGEFYELVLFEGEHHAFTDRELNATQAPRNPAHHAIIEGLSTAFWDATLRVDLSALSWLRGDGALSVLEPGDSWQFK